MAGDRLVGDGFAVPVLEAVVAVVDCRVVLFDDGVDPVTVELLSFQPDRIIDVGIGV